MSYAFLQTVFVYASLKDAATRKKALGVDVPGVRDVLFGYTKQTDPSGFPYLAKSTGLVPGRVEGLRLQLTTAQVNKLDAWEDKRYNRVKVKLASGTMAWIYDENEPGT